jgi:hypothetical protein
LESTESKKLSPIIFIHIIFTELSGEGIQEIFKSLATNQTLTELKLANQVLLGVGSAVDVRQSN